MKQKYLILRNPEKKELIIREFAELDKEAFSMLCEEIFQDEQINSAINMGKDALISTLRTKNMYPIGKFAAQIAEEVIALYQSKDSDSIELFFDDIDILRSGRKTPPSLDQLENDSVEIDELIGDDNSDEDFDDSDIDNISYPIKIADDNSVGTDNEE